MNSQRICLVAAILIVWFVPTTSAADKTTLRYEFKEGDTLKYVVESSMQSMMNINLMVVTTKMSQSSEMVWTVKSVDRTGKADLKIKFGRQKTTSESAQIKTEIDSEMKEEPNDELGKTLYKLAKTMSRLEFSATLSPTGEFSDIKIPEQIIKELEKTKNPLLNETVTAVGLQRTLNQTALLLPKEPVEKGQSWKSQSSLPMPFGKMILDIDHEFAGTTTQDGRKLAKITLKPKAQFELAENSRIAAKLKSQEGMGNALFDVSTGRLVEVTTRRTMDLELEVSGTTVSQRVEQSSTMRLVEKK